MNWNRISQPQFNQGQLYKAVHGLTMSYTFTFFLHAQNHPQYQLAKDIVRLKKTLSMAKSWQKPDQLNIRTQVKMSALKR